MKRAINLACFMGIGFVLGTAGVTIADWQLYAVLSFAATASISAELMQ
jgi:hypothetical protein